MITGDMRAVIEATHLCFVATVTPDGRPNLSPKGTIRVWDDTHLFFLDIASPRTRGNLDRSPWMEINVVEPLSRRGYRFFGKAVVHGHGSAICDDAVRRAFGDSESAYPVNAAVILEVERAEPLLSPAYWRVSDENDLRAMWRERREAMDRAFEAHVAAAGPVRVDPQPLG